MQQPVVILKMKDGRVFEILARSDGQLDRWTDPAPYQLTDVLTQYIPADVLAEAPRVLQKR
jgi:hypothetical protein